MIIERHLYTPSAAVTMNDIERSAAHPCNLGIYHSETGVN